MIHVVEGHTAHRHAGLIEDMMRSRARVFKDRLGWNVTVKDGLERDRFDDESPIYIIHTDAGGRVNASCRLLPTTGPTLLSEIFSDTLPDDALMVAPTIWECTRLCVDYDAAEPEELQSVVRVCASLVAAIGAIALRAGVEAILGNFDAVMLRIYRRVGCRVEVLGSTHRFGRPVYLGSFPVSQEIVASVKRRLQAPASSIVRDDAIALA